MNGTDETIEIPAVLAAEIVLSVQGLLNATSIAEQAGYVTTLHNEISDLKTWVPGFDIETGLIPAEVEDV